MGKRRFFLGRGGQKFLISFFISIPHVIKISKVWRKKIMLHRTYIPRWYYIKNNWMVHLWFFYIYCFRHTIWKYYIYIIHFFFPTCPLFLPFPYFFLNSGSLGWGGGGHCQEESGLGKLLLMNTPKPGSTTHNDVKRSLDVPRGTEAIANPFHKICPVLST